MNSIPQTRSHSHVIQYEAVCQWQMCRHVGICAFTGQLWAAVMCMDSLCVVLYLFICVYMHGCVGVTGGGRDEFSC